jgi:thiamine-phosphate pyrophosphorylase
MVESVATDSSWTNEAMLPEMTPAVARALEAARHWAARTGSSDVQPLHVFLGLTDEEEGRAVVLLTAAGLDVTSVRGVLTGGGVAGPPAPDIGLNLHSSVVHILTEARLLASDLSGERIVGSEALVLTLVRADAELRQSLQSHGLDVTRLEAKLDELRGPALQLDEPLQLQGPTDLIDAARVLDANANRAREALRVIEDHCRFILDDALLSGELKHLRHDLTTALTNLGPEPTIGLAARETLRDVGTDIATEREEHRYSSREVLLANWKRLQEALRSLEEFGKLHSPDLGRALQSVRYRSYTLEKALLVGSDARERLAHAHLYVLLTGARCARTLDWTIQEAAAGGADVFQLREKEMDDRRLLERARQVRQWTRKAGVLFILNDRPDLARLAEADGVHLGQDDLPVKEARRILGPNALIGVSSHNLEQLRQAVLDGANYVGLGPTFPSGTKEFETLAGLEFVRQASGMTSVPAFVIGGINAENLDSVLASGGRRVAVSQAVCMVDEPRSAAADLRRRLNASMQKES